MRAEKIRSWFDAGGGRVGEVLLRGNFELLHHADGDRSDLAVQTNPEAARAIAVYDEAGQFRPLKSASNLKRGWLLQLASLDEVALAMEFIYPAGLGIWLASAAGNLEVTPLRETLDRQTGMYAVTKKITTQEAVEMVNRACSGCLKQIRWDVDGEPTCQAGPDPSLRNGTLFCPEGCNLLVAEARSVVKKRG